MTSTTPPTADRFEDRLLHQLRDRLPTHAEAEPGPARHQRRRLVLGGGLATATAAIMAGVLAVTAGNPAYAIHARPDGSFVVVLEGTAADNLAAAERELRRNGARIELVTSTLDCLGVFNSPDPTLPAEPHGPRNGPPRRGEIPEFDAFSPATGANGRRNPATGDRLTAREWAFIVRPDAIPADKVLWVAVTSTGATLVAVAAFAPVGAGQPNFCASG